jgi:hypothetical protein
MAVAVWPYFWIIYSVPLIYTSVFMPVTFLLLWLQIKWTQIGKEEVKLLLFVDDKPIFKDPKDCIENPYSW